MLLLGHTGFIGRHLSRHLQANDFEVAGLSRKRCPLDEPGSASTLQDHYDEDTTIIVLAGIKPQRRDDAGALRENMQIASTLAEALEEKHPAKVIYFSSAAVYGEDNHNLAIDEETPTDPQSYYGIAKLATEQALERALSDHEGTELIHLRPPLIYGPGDESQGYGPTGFLRTAMDGKSITLWGDGEELRNFVYVEDAVRIVRRLVGTAFQGPLNLASSRGDSFKDTAETVAELLDRDVTIESRTRTGSKVDNRFDNDRLTQLFPEFEFHPLDEGLAETYGRIRKHRNEPTRS